jgi:anti-sigma-K factor RskA
MSGEPEDFDLLAAEYVIGVLDVAEAQAVEALAAREDALAVAIEQWQNRLAPLALAAAPVPPSDALWKRLAESIGGFPAEPTQEGQLSALRAEVVPFRRHGWGGAGVWRAATAAALALAAAFAAIAFLQRPPPAPQFVAALSPANAPGPSFIAETEPDGSILVRPLARVAVENGKDLELWALPQGATKPVSLGVMPAIGRHIRLGDMPREATQLLVSLEPLGGSPTGLPTGPVLFAGTLTKLD